MAGLALGSYFASKIVDKISKLIKLYGFIEISIGLLALLIYPLYIHLNLLYSPIYTYIGDSFFLLTITRFILATVVLILPTALMGATVPVLIKAVTDSLDVLGRRSGRLYAINTLGAVTGTLLCGFLLIPQLGLSKTNYLAVAFNILVGGIAILIPWEESKYESTRIVPIPTYEQRWAYFAAFLAGFVALGYEVIWTRSLVFAIFLGSTTYAFSTMLAAFLSGITIGSWLFSYFVDRSKNLQRLFFLVESLMGLVSVILISLVIAGKLQPTVIDNFFIGAIFDFVKAFLLMLVPTIFMGAVFPILVRYAGRSNDSIGMEAGRVYSSNTMGAIFGSFFSGFILIPTIGLSGSAIFFSVTALIVSLIFFVFGSRKKQLSMPLIFCSVLIMAGIIFTTPSLNFKSYFINQGKNVCYYKEGSAATITMTEDLDGFKGLWVDVFLAQGSNDMIAMSDIKSLAHLPTLLHPSPKRVCTIGFGTGGTSYSFTLHPEYEEIICAEIDMNIPRGYQCFQESNHGFLEDPDPRYHIVQDDARAFLENTPKFFDVITVDLADIANRGESDLYTKDFLEVCNKRLNSGGLNVVWLSVKSLSPPTLKTLLKTVLSVYPQENVTIWHLTNYPNHDLLIVARKDIPLEIDVENLIQRMARPSVAKDLAEINLDNPYKLLSCYYVPASALNDYFGEVPIHTVDKPVLEFEAPKDRFKTISMWQNLLELFWQIRDPYPPIKTIHPEEFSRQMNHELEVRNLYLQGELAVLQSQNLIKGSLQFRKALELSQDDNAILFCLGASDWHIQLYKQRLQDNPEDADPAILLTLAHITRNEIKEAKISLEVLQRIQSNNPVIKYLAGRLAEAEGNYNEALNYYNQFLPSATPEYANETTARIEIMRLLSRPKISDQDEEHLVQYEIQAGMIRSALQRAKHLLEIAGDSLDNKIWYSMILRDAGLLYDSANMLEAVLKESPDRPDIWYLLGDIYLQIRLTSQAEHALNNALQLDSRNPSIYYNLARLYSLLDQPERSIEYLKKGTELGGPDLMRLATQDPIFHTLF